MSTTNTKPRNVRNFWIEVEIDGRKYQFAGGPKTRDGGFQVTIKQRNDGQVTDAMHIEGKSYEDGTLQLEARLNVEYWSGEPALIAVSKR